MSSGVCVVRQSQRPGPDGACLTRPRCERRTGAFVSLGHITVAWCIACGWGFAVLSARQCVGSEKKQGALTWRCCHLRLHCYHSSFIRGERSHVKVLPDSILVKSLGPCPRRSIASCTVPTLISQPSLCSHCSSNRCVRHCYLGPLPISRLRS